MKKVKKTPKASKKKKDDKKVVSKKKATASKTTKKAGSKKKATKAKKAVSIKVKAVKSKSSSKKAAPKKKATAKKAAPKKTAAKKATTRKTAAKSTAKKATTRKTVAKPAAKKTTTRKTAAKSTAKKATTRKTAAKPAAKKTTTRKTKAAAKPKRVTRTTRKKTVAKAKPINIVKTLKNEVWKKVKLPVPAITSDYFISNMGRIKNKNKRTKSEILMKGYITKPRGYQTLNLKLQEGKRASFYVHKLVADYFVSKNKRRGQLFATHKNGKRLDNRAANMIWLDQKELTAHHMKIGTYEFHRPHTLGAHVVMNEAKVRRLKKDLMKGKLTRTKLSEKYGITMTQIKRIDRGENWGNVTID